MPGGESSFLSMARDIYTGCCTCLSACKPRWKRLVDNIFPAIPEDGLVRSNMAKLTFYAVSHNEKLDRIGGYLAKRLDRDVYRQRVGYVFIAMQALDELLLACHAQSLNLFVESFLKMVHKLLESNNTDLQILGTNSFVKFSNIEEDTPSYHRRYDFFISKFSSMCHNNSENMETRRKIRLAGLKGLQGVVRKTVSDDLQVNIWDKTHMDKIVPSFLFNMHEGFDMRESPVQEHAEGKPEVLAETCLRDVMRRAAYANIHAVLKPVLRHLDLHEMWVPNDFAIKAFKVIMYSIQSQYRYVTPHFLLLHLDENMRNTPQIKRSMVGVLKETVAIAADGAVGPSVLEIFNSLLRHLRSSVDQRLSNEGTPRQNSQKPEVVYSEEMLFEEAIIDTIGAFASILPDYQKIEIMMFIMGKVPLPNRRSIREEEETGEVLEMNEEGDILLQNRLLKSLLEVANQYTTVSMATTFPASFLQPLLNMSVVRSPEIRLVVQEIFHTLLDRHNNTEKLYRNCEISKDITEVGLTVEKASRQDILFMRKNGADIQWHIYENLTRPQNSTENFVSIYCTLALLVAELGIDDILVDLIRLSLALQNLACDPESKLPSAHRCAIHATVGRYFNLIGQLTAIPALCQHVWTVIEARQKSAPDLLPPIKIQLTKQSSGSHLNLDSLQEEYLFQYEVISEALSSSGLDASRLATPYVHEYNEPRPHSATDLGSIHIDLESTQSSPAGVRKHPQEQITFESLKRILISSANDGSELEDDRDRRLDILHSFQNSTLEELASAAEQKNEKWQKKLNEILEMVINTPVTPAGSPTRPDPTAPMQIQSVPTYEMTFPELCVF